MLSKPDAADHAVQEMNAVTDATITFGTGGGRGEPSATITFGTGGGRGEPSATITFGTGGGRGEPSATITFGTGGGKGEPSATLTVLLKLTIALTGVTINAARAKSARHNLFLFTLEPPRLTMNGNKKDQNWWFKKFCLRNSAGALMETLTQLQQNRRIIQDFTMTTLAGIPGLLSRLTYIASLRDLSSGRYEHAGLAALYPDSAIQQALEICHEQVFEKILETPLASQEADLRACLDAMEAGREVSAVHWQRMEAYRVLLPEHAPDYLKELFCSNLRALLEILQPNCSTAR